MTVQYQGNDQYKIWLGDDRCVELSKQDIIDIQDLNEFEGCKVMELVNKLGEIEDTLLCNGGALGNIERFVDECAGNYDAQHEVDDEFADMVTDARLAIKELKNIVK